MARNLRFIPPGSLVEVTCRTLQGRFLLRPSRDLNEIALGIFVRAAEMYDVKVVAFVVLSNHMHLLVVPADAEQLASFMNYVNGNLAREAGRLYAWRAKFWARRYRAIVVSDEERAQAARLRYLLSQGCKEGLVRTPRDWPGASSTESLLSGRPVVGIWIDRTALLYARRKDPRLSKYARATEEALELAPLPAWKHLSGEEIRRRVEEMVDEIEAKTRAELAATGRKVLGVKRVSRLNPHASPGQTPSSPAPRFHTASRRERNRLQTAYELFQSAFRQAAEALRSGDGHADFPEGSFPPHLPFQPHLAPRGAPS